MLVKVGLVNRLGTGTGGENRASNAVDDEGSRKEMRIDPLDQKRVTSEKANG